MALFARIREDIGSIKERDPAARSKLEILLCYPGLWAVWFYLVSHTLWRAKLRLPARILSQIARFFTGVDIHPGALLGRRLFIDHATGVVIGETAIVGSDVTIYQGVTLGGTGKGHGKRHPTICDGVFIGNNSNVLGNITVGANSRVGAGSVVLSDVPPNSTVVGVPAHIVYQNGERVLITDPNQIKDPLSGVIVALADDRHQGDAFLNAMAQSEQDPVEGLALLLELHGESLDDPRRADLRRVGIQGWAEALRNPTVLASVTEGSSLVRKEIVRLIARGQRTGQIRREIEPEAVARMLIALFRGLTLEVSLGEDAGLANVGPLIEDMIRGALFTEAGRAAHPKIPHASKE